MRPNRKGLWEVANCASDTPYLPRHHTKKPFQKKNEGKNGVHNATVGSGTHASGLRKGPSMTFPLWGYSNRSLQDREKSNPTVSKCFQPNIPARQYLYNVQRWGLPFQSFLPSHSDHATQAMQFQWIQEIITLSSQRLYSIRIGRNQPKHFAYTVITMSVRMDILGIMSCGLVMSSLVQLSNKATTNSVRCASCHGVLKSFNKTMPDDAIMVCECCAAPYSKRTKYGFEGRRYASHDFRLHCPAWRDLHSWLWS